MIEVALCKNDDTPLAGDAGALVTLFALKFNVIPVGLVRGSEVPEVIADGWGAAFGGCGGNCLWSVVTGSCAQ